MLVENVHSGTVFCVCELPEIEISSFLCSVGAVRIRLTCWRLHAQDRELHKYLLLTHVGSLRTENNLSNVTATDALSCKWRFLRGGRV